VSGKLTCGFQTELHCGDVGGHNQSRLEEYLEVVDLEVIDLKAANLEAVKLEAFNLEVVDPEACAMEAENLFIG